MKWSTPTFTYKGILAGMAAFKQYCTFGLWKWSLIVDSGTPEGEKASARLGRITKVSDLPSRRVLSGYIKEAMRLNDEGVKVPRMKPKEAAPREVVVPAELSAALKRNRKARETFESFSPSHKREYAEWIADAKREETRQRRVDTAIEWMAAGKPRNWKYM